jgi:PAS domain S-box-containing protein
MVASPTSGHSVSQPKLRSNGLLITLVTLIVIEVLTRTVFRVPAGAILLLPVAYAAFTGGLRSGFISAALMLLYALYFFALPDQFLQYTSASVQTIAVLALVAAAMVVMIGSLKRRIEQLSRRNELILHSAGEGICGLDAQGTITFLNPAAATMCGWTIVELIGQPIHLLMRHPHVDGTSVSSVDKPSNTAWQDLSVRVVAEGAFWRKDGTSFPVEYIRSPKWEQRTLVGAVVTFKDINERKRAEAALRERESSFRLLFANNPMPMWVYDLDTLAFLEVNQAAIAHYGYSRDEFITMRITDIRPPDDVPLLLAQLTEGRPALEVTGPWRHRLHDGRLITVIIHSHTLDFAGRPAALVVAEDITERQQAADAIQHLNADLERRVAERTAQLEATNKELEAFSYSVSHDLRAPLRSIDGFSLALLEDYGDRLDSDGQDYLQRVRTATQRMSQLIDDLLSLARVTRSALEYESVDLSARARTIAEDLQRAQPDRQVEFLIAPDLIAQGDGRLLQVMLENLLDNAWKFTTKRPGATIEFGAIPCDGQVAYFVRDNGAGFDMAYADKLFGAFQRLHAMNEFAGTGIGLATVQRIIHRHGGRVWAEGAVEQGATFYFTLS